MVKRVKAKKKSEKGKGAENPSPPALRGRPLGVPNKHTAIVKHALLLAAEALGDLEPMRHQNGKLQRNADGTPKLIHKPGHNELTGYLMWLGRNHPTSFASMLTKTIPQAVTGHDEGPVRIQYESPEELAQALRAKGMPPQVINELSRQVFGDRFEGITVEGTMTKQ